MKKRYLTPEDFFDVIAAIVADGVIDAEWNKATQEQRNAMVKPLMRVVANRYTTIFEELYDIMESENFHTEMAMLKSVLTE